MTIGDNMEIVLIILTSTLISAFIFASYQFGIYKGKQIQSELDKNDVVKINKGNQKAAREYGDFSNFQG